MRWRVKMKSIGARELEIKLAKNWKLFWSLCSETRLVQLDYRSARRTQKINFPTNQKGYDNSETTVGKLSTIKNRSSEYIFLMSFFDLLFLKTSENMDPTKIYPANLDSPRQTP